MKVPTTTANGTTIPGGKRIFPASGLNDGSRCSFPLVLWQYRVQGSSATGMKESRIAINQLSPLSLLLPRNTTAR
jgi:hypothetical protein